MLNITIVLSGFDLGGAERQALNLAQALEKRGCKVVMMGCTPGRVIEICEEHHIAWVKYPIFHLTRLSGRRALSNFISIIKFALLLRKSNPDVIISYLTVPNIASSILWRFAGARLHIWNQRDLGLARSAPWLEKLAIRLAPVIVSNSRAGADFLIQQLGASKKKIHIIHNSVDLPSPRIDRYQWRKNLAIPDDAFIACMVANLTKYKDHSTLLHAWQLLQGELAKEKTQVYLVLAGAYGDKHQELERLAVTLNIQPSLRFTGPIPDISGLLFASDLGILSSRSEGLSNAVLEYMVCGLPVVGTNISGIREALAPENQPFLAEIGNAQELANYIGKFARDPVLRKRIGEQNADHVQKNFSQEQFREKTLAIIFNQLSGEEA